VGHVDDKPEYKKRFVLKQIREANKLSLNYVIIKGKTFVVTLRPNSYLI
jgi:hypothetical protein